MGKYSETCKYPVLHQAALINGFWSVVLVIYFDAEVVPDLAGRILFELPLTLSPNVLPSFCEHSTTVRCSRLILHFAFPAFKVGEVLCCWANCVLSPWMLVRVCICVHLTEHVSTFFLHALVLWIIYFPVPYMTTEILEERSFVDEKPKLRKAVWLIQGDISSW